MSYLQENGVYMKDIDGKLIPQPDPTTASIDALRQAVVAQTALLRSLSEQVRLGFEDKTLKGSLDGFLQATAVWFEKTWKQQAGLAERLDKLEPQKPTTATEIMLLAQAEEDSLRMRKIILDLPGRLAAIEANLTPPDAERIFTPEELKKLERDFKFKPLRTTRPAPKGAARRKAKR